MSTTSPGRPVAVARPGSTPLCLCVMGRVRIHATMASSGCAYPDSRTPIGRHVSTVPGGFTRSSLAPAGAHDG